MTEFRAPPLPPELETNEENVENIKLEDLADIKHIDPKILGLAAILLIGGVLLGALFFGSSSSSNTEQPVIQGLTNLVKNPDIKEQLAYCGQVSETSPCVLYIMNHTRRDRVADDFFEEAAKLTRRNKYTVEIENTGYAKMRIRPSFFAEIKIPALR